MTRPRIAIDARTLAGNISGFGRYTRTLLAGLAETADEPLLVLIPPNLDESDFTLSTRLIPRETTGRMADPFAQRRLARSLARDGIQLLHCPDAFAPLTRDVRTITTIHDLIPLHFARELRQTAKGRLPGLWKRWLRIQCRAADAVAVVSEHTRRDVIASLDVPESKAHIIPAAVAPHPITPRTAPGPMLLCVGRTPPYKNVAAAVHALAIIRETVPSAHLTIVGQREDRYPQTADAARQLGLTDAVRFTGHVSEEQLDALYRSAAVFVFPSLAEGFGLPPLEAMARGVPVVASNRASIPEVLGDAAILIDPADHTAFAAAALRILTDPQLARDLSARGLARAEAWSPRRQATAAIAAYRALLDRPS